MKNTTDLTALLGNANLKIKYLEKEVLNLRRKLRESNNKVLMLNRKLYPVKKLHYDDNSIDKLLSVIESKFGVDISLKIRNIEIAYPRHLFNYWLCHNTNMSLQAIGDIFDYDHSTIINSKKKIEDLISYNKDVRKDYAEICQAMKRTYTEDEIVINPS